MPWSSSVSQVVHGVEQEDLMHACRAYPQQRQDGGAILPRLLDWIRLSSHPRVYHGINTISLETPSLETIPLKLW
jgi:hypothetical protein